MRCNKVGAVSRLRVRHSAARELAYYYADHLSDAALEWLIKNKVIKSEQRGDIAAILSGISDWLERAQNE